MSNSDKSSDAATVRVERATRRVQEATRRARTARIEAAPALLGRARRRTRWFWLALVGAVVVVVVLLVASVILGVRVRSADALEGEQAAVIGAADAAVVAMLSADPADPQAYVDKVLDVSAGARRERLEGLRDAIAAEVGKQSGPSVGQVISSGLVSDPPDDPADGARADVLTVADATNPALLGGGAPSPSRDVTAQRITVALTMIRTADGWRVADARAL